MNTAEARRRTEAEVWLQWECKRKRNLKRCPRCGTKNEIRNKLDTCLACVMKERKN